MSRLAINRETRASETIICVLSPTTSDTTKLQSGSKSFTKVRLSFLRIKDNEMHYFSNLFDKVLYMFRTGPLSIIRSISTLYTQQYMPVMLAVASDSQHNWHVLLCIQC